MNNNKYIKILIICLSVVFGFCINMDGYAEENNSQLTDQAGLLQETEAAGIKGKIEAMEEETGWDIMAVTTEDAEGFSSEFYAEKWFDNYAGSENGVLYLIDMDNREIVLKTFGEAIEYITDNRRDTILDNAYEQIAQEKYAQTIEEMLGGTEKYYKDGIHSSQYTYNEDTQQVKNKEEVKPAVSKESDMPEAVNKEEENTGLNVTVIFFSVVIALALGSIISVGIISSYRGNFGDYKFPIEKNGSIRLRKEEDLFINQFVTQRQIKNSQENSTNVNINVKITEKNDWSSSHREQEKKHIQKEACVNNSSGSCRSEGGRVNCRATNSTDTNRTSQVSSGNTSGKSTVHTGAGGRTSGGGSRKF